MRKSASFLILALAACSFAQNNEEYGKKIKEFTSEPFFLTELVDHLPASATVPSPDKFLGHIIGAPNVLDYSKQAAEYLRLLEKSSPRVKIFSMGTSEEGREMVVALISDEANLARLPRLREINGLLGDPRKIKNEKDVDALVAEGIPMYWATGGMHAPETGPPEMLLELAYRLAVSETPMIRNIRKNEIVMITPVLDVDGRDRVVDLYRYRKANPTKPSIPLVYWGHYVAHDDNRDGMAMSLELSKAVSKVWMENKPLVFHDLHESVPYLYISTGTGPYNPSYDPITIDEWHILAYNEIDEMTKRGVPGVWTHDFYDGWAPSYGFMVANGHNGIGRFYETFGGNGADSGILSAAGRDTRQWFRPNPPFPRVRWSIRSNVNLMQSALLVGLDKVATEKEKFLRNYYLKAKRSIAKATTEGPAAYVFPASDPRPGNRAKLIAMLEAQGVEVGVLRQEITTKDGKFAAGSWIVRMDQPYSRMADMMLDKQYYNPSDPRSYDDTGWQLGPLHNVDVVRCLDNSILKAEVNFGWMSKYSMIADFEGTFLLHNHADVVDTLLALTTSKLEVRVLNKAAKAEGEDFKRGDLVLRTHGGSLNSVPHVKLSRYGASDVDQISAKLSPPRVALVHSWTSTQDEGWWRMAFDQMGLAYSYIPVQALRDSKNLKSKFDVIILPPGGGSPQGIVNGLPKIGDPIAWKPSKEYPNLGGPDQSDDIRGGIELTGVLHLQEFVEAGGLLICAGQTCGIPIQYGLVNGVTQFTPTQLAAPGGVFLTENQAKTSPVLSGYGDTLPVYFNQYTCSMLQVGGGGGVGRRGTVGQSTVTRPSGRGSLTDPDVVQGRPPYTPKTLPEYATPNAPRGPQPPQAKVLLRFADQDKLLVSGMLDHGEELAGKAALVDCTVGKGHILLFSLNPFWRMQTVGSYNLFFNALLHWDRLGSGG
jgi:hypothetical protein